MNQAPHPSAVRRKLVVVGSGIAGLYAALLAAEGGADVVLLSKASLADSNTSYAQGGISAVLEQPAPGDTVAAHIEDTLSAGAGHCDPEAVRILCREAFKDIAGLVRFGVPFDVNDHGAHALGLEAAHSAPRILHSGGDATGAGISGALIAAVLTAQDGPEARGRGRIRVLANTQATSLIQDSGRVSGVEYLHAGRLEAVTGDAVLLATGGAGRLFAQTTNPAIATADGVALAWRAGAAVADVEFFQFHPTCMVQGAGVGGVAPEPLLISEAVRGEGAVLVDANGYRFMPDYHVDAELAPRDVVSRSIALHLASLGTPNGHVFLDATVIEQAKGPGFLAKRFPTITVRTAQAGVDWTRELVPVAPAAHYWMGGVLTDLDGRTSVPGLLAAGEVACTGVQGANRLASNSLLEGLVFGRRAVEAFLSQGDEAVVPARRSSGAPGDGTPKPALVFGTRGLDKRDPVPPFSRTALQRLLTANAGVLRNGELLQSAADTLGEWAAVVLPELAADALDPKAHEDANLLLAAQLLVQAAQARTSSLGAHYRSDAPQPPAHNDLLHRYTMSRKASLVHD
ncbi:L-aspartate oxidase [Arthrobacter sp. M4]|uniref:L-aspartate oxidase n=1 Tax=Arthrobacter sp. M4 TaxID=218160 RepID=UPI001CDB91BF|nr:L-aspartate oxidase [Arthrobacter sp. M4]MCA4132125.1 L-aspartate oxidase [Arthrobacter sp. M4]